MLRYSNVNKFEFPFIFKKRGCREERGGSKISSNLINTLKSILNADWLSSQKPSKFHMEFSWLLKK